MANALKDVLGKTEPARRAAGSRAARDGEARFPAAAGLCPGAGGSEDGAPRARAEQSGDPAAAAPVRRRTAPLRLPAPRRHVGTERHCNERKEAVPAHTARRACPSAAGAAESARPARARRRRTSAGRSDVLSWGRKFRVLAIVDDFTREALALVVDSSISAWISRRPSAEDHSQSRLAFGKPGAGRSGAQGIAYCGRVLRRSSHPPIQECGGPSPRWRGPSQGSFGRFSA